MKKNLRQAKKLYKRISYENWQHGMICADPDSKGWKQHPRLKHLWKRENNDNQQN